ncbi:beta-N-acetylglucosaminidase domain-containing protein [Streptomyces sp. DSM 41527]|uniref:Beta-N-acetylglucosaminidase domain-containing protein n=1 Tax=Streptomyces mooreae TaxID=3075523 RepID=A0ABU2T7G1_9ACTN|nr:beta-N-acetylglucosaminidase domain-containing protein [Streptomyces sp. DSM 41527]MDT0456559.1 beta-N-acetylglucosaminidase domain-containing protein [Streptomyces sp. DSM 41527]
MAGTTALAAAVIGGLLGGVPSAQAAPADPAVGAPDRPDRPAGAGRTPTVWPRPQSMRELGDAVPLGREAVLVAAPDTDPHTLHALRGLLHDAGVHTVRQQAPGDRLPPAGPVIHVGGEQAAHALRALRAPARGDLPAGGYRLAVGRVAGRDTVALDGVGPDGLFHAAQTLRQLVTHEAEEEEASRSDSGRGGGGRRAGKQLASVAVRDWPGTAVRGTTEGFFGQPWSQAQRLAQLDFMGRTKQNRYLYAPGDDPYRQARWRDPYPAGQRAGFRALAERARANHVTLGWAVAPGQAMCLSSEEDLRALRRKVDAMWALGVRSFQLQFQDVSYSEWHCDADADAFGTGPGAAARAQARVANALATHLAQRHPQAGALSLMPTEYYQDGSTAYRRALSDALGDRVEVAWTGVGVVPRTITGSELSTARQVFGHPLVTMDNYPVNDYAQDRIFLGPYRGREPAVATGSTALLANAMQQPLASRIPLFTAADYAWNPRDYHPGRSWNAAVDDLAGGDPRSRAALRALAGNASSSLLERTESGYLQPLIDRFWKAREVAVNHGRPGRDPDLAKAAKALRAAFATMSTAPRDLRPDLAAEVRPWAEQLARYGRAGAQAVDTLMAQAHDDGDAAWSAQRSAQRLRKECAHSPATVGKGVLAPFLERAMTEADAWTGARRTAPEPGDGAGEREGRTSLTVPFERTRPLAAVTALTDPGPSAAAVSMEAHVPGEGWRRLDRLSASGWTEAKTPRLRADAVRLTWAKSAHAPSVHAFTPWFDDTPAAGLELSRKESDAQNGGSATVDALIYSRRPGDVRGKLAVKAPKGFTVHAPEQVTAPRGGTATVRITLGIPENAPSGTYEIPVEFGGAERTLTVRSYPPTGGKDLARGTVVTSSGDETADFPASAATDGNPATRWSSAPEDGAWLQFALAHPTRLGRLVLNWQDAYAARYRVQVSTDGRSWRTAATVRDGKGGRESVRMDAQNARFVRIQGDKRATRFGYSLWSVEAYAVAEARHPGHDKR